VCKVSKKQAERIVMIPENGKSFELFGLIVRVPDYEELHEEFVSENVVERVFDQDHRQYGDDDQIISVQESFDEMVSDRPSENKKILVVLDCANIGWYIYIICSYLCIHI
jgi:hypothetical protein